MKLFTFHQWDFYFLSTTTSDLYTNILSFSYLFARPAFCCIFFFLSSLALMILVFFILRSSSFAFFRVSAPCHDH